jgi:hypothetical protein
MSAIAMVLQVDAVQPVVRVWLSATTPEPGDKLSLKDGPSLRESNSVLLAESNSNAHPGKIALELVEVGSYLPEDSIILESVYRCST